MDNLRETALTYLKEAESEFDCAGQVLLDPRLAGRTAEPHLARAWYSLCCCVAVRTANEVPAWDTFEEQLKTMWMGGAGGWQRKDWLAEILSFRKQAVPHLETGGEAEAAVRTKVRAHWDLLSLRLEQERKNLGVHPLKELGGRRIALAAVLLVLIIAGAYRIVPFAPWRMERFKNDKLFGVAESVKKQTTLVLPAGNFANRSLRFDSCLKADDDGTFVFELGSDDGSRLIVDGANVVDMWRPQSFASKQGEVKLLRGWHHIRVEYFQKGGRSGLSLKLKGADGNFADISSAKLHYPAEGISCKHLSVE